MNSHASNVILRCAPTLDEIADAYFAERRHLKTSTLNTYRFVMTKHLSPVFGATPWDAVEAHTIAKYRSELACTAAPRTVNKVIGLLKALTKWAAKRGLCTDAEMKIGAMDSVREELTQIDPFTLQELDAVLAHIKPWYRQYFALLAWSGARPSELQALRWKDCRADNSEIHINKARVRGIEGTPKTRSSNRRIPLSGPAQAALATQRQYSHSDEHNYVFITRKGEPITKHMDLMWKRACIRAGVRPRPQYSLRHTFASLALAAGETPAFVARVLGHSTMETLYRHYARWIPNADRDGKMLQSAIVNHYSSSAPAVVGTGRTVVLGLDPIDRFLLSCTMRDEGVKVEAYDLYAAYVSWAGQQGLQPLNRNMFGRCMSARGFLAKKLGRGRFKYLGIHLFG